MKAIAKQIRNHNWIFNVWELKIGLPTKYNVTLAIDKIWLEENKMDGKEVEIVAVNDVHDRYDSYFKLAETQKPVMKTERIVVEITHYDDPKVPPEARYIATISEGEYPLTCESGASVSECFKQISISMFVLDEYRKKNSKK